RYGQAKFRVNTTRKKLNIEVKSSKENYLPGEEVQLNFSVKNWQNKPVETELSVAVVDLSVLALKGNPKENPLLFFYNDLPLTVITSSNVKNILQELDVPKGTKGGGGGDAQKKRGQFKDTAFWKAVLKTDANGQAIAKFKLPDNLTTWQVETIGITKDTKVGVKYNEFIARKELMLTPLKPRFVIPGDEIKIGAKIFNQSDKKQDLAVFFQSETLALANKDSGQDISIKSGETQTVYFDVTVPAGKQTGTHKFVLSAKNKTLEDTVEQVIKITRNDTYEATATSGYSKEKQVNEYLYIPENVVPDRGEVKISANATLAVFLSDAINYLVDYPYGCAEQIASKLETLAIVKNGLQTKNIGQKLQVKDIEIDGQTYTIDEAITLGLGKIYEKQNQGGGFGYFPNLNSDFYLTMRVVTALQKLDKAGIGISKQRLTRGLDYISRIIRSGFIAPQVPVTNNDLILAGFVLGQTNDDKLSYIAPKIKELISNDKYLNEESNNSALAYLAITTAQNPKMFGKDSKNKVYNTLENRLLIDARGAHIPESKTPLWRYYETGIKNTALYLQALIADNRDNNELGSILRWLLNSRSKDNAWETTSNTATAIDTFTQYLLWQDENNADFALDLLINDTEIVQAGLVPASASTSGLMPAASNAASNVQAGLVPASNKAGTRPAPTTPTFNFNKDNLLQQQTYKIQPLSKLPLNKLISLVFQKTDRNKKANNFYYDILFKYFLPIEAIAPRDEGFTITRNFYKTDDAKFEQKITQAKVGDILRRHIEIIVPEERHFVAIEDFIPAGVELINFNLSTENINTIKTPDTNDQPRNPYYYAEESTLKSSPLNPQMQELRDDRLFLFMESLNPGTYSFDYYARVLIPGKFHHLPAVISEMYFPENFGRTSGGWFEVE
ncbi:MAG: hypothetical protein NTZ80_03360, partial [Patescibacteria group bacterium]|nr:hypothetical protein [Patescibacteria group bacterium]